MTKVNVTNFENRTSKTNQPFLSLETDRGKMSVWDTVIITDIQNKGVGQYDFTLEAKGDFVNVKGIIGPNVPGVTNLPGTEAPTQATITPGTIPSRTPYVAKPTFNKWGNQQDERFASMALSYAKDLAVAGKIDVNKIRSETLGFASLYNELVQKLKIGAIDVEKTS